MLNKDMESLNYLIAHIEKNTCYMNKTTAP